MSEIKLGGGAVMWNKEGQKGQTGDRELKQADDAYRQVPDSPLPMLWPPRS